MSDIDLRLPRRDVGRLLALVIERRRKLDRGVQKFGKDFDPALGANMLESQQAFNTLEQALMEAMNEGSYTCRAGCDSQKHKMRDKRSGNYCTARRKAAAISLGAHYGA